MVFMAVDTSLPKNSRPSIRIFCTASPCTSTDPPSTFMPGIFESSSSVSASDMTLYAEAL